MSLRTGFYPARVHEQRFTVGFEYPVVFCRAAFRLEEQTLAWAIAHREPERRHPVYAVIDAGLSDAQPELKARIVAYAAEHSASLELVAAPHELPGGEAAKNDPELVRKLWQAFARARLDRHAVVLAIGGGAVLDAVGFAAATTHRGVRLVRMPSTVLSQNDAGVGVKTSLNGFGAKNFVGTFTPPFAVVNDADLLATLPLREARAGLAEAVKVGLIRDSEFFAWLEANAAALGRAESAPLERAIQRCAELHLRHIASGGDPFESGSKRPLDYGHWAAHKLETLSEHGIRHGEAVAIGMALDAKYAELSGLLSTSALGRIVNVLERIGLALYHPLLSAESEGRLAILQGLQEFREHLGGTLTVTLLTDVGASREVSELDERVVAAAIAWLRDRAGA
jgi:3-dehydroquinate synthase